MECEKNENKQKEAGIGPFLKKVVLTTNFGHYFWNRLAAVHFSEALLF